MKKYIKILEIISGFNNSLKINTSDFAIYKKNKNNWIRVGISGDGDWEDIITDEAVKEIKKEINEGKRCYTIIEEISENEAFLELI